MNRIISSLITLFAVAGLQAQQPVEVPRMVVNIVIDQLRGDYIHYFSSTFGERGFKRLYNEGLIYQHADFGFSNLNEASSAAAIYTGTYPYYNGIPSARRYDPALRREVSIAHDNDYLGNYTSDRFSPLVLTSSTVGDEIKMATEGRSQVFAIAPNPETAIVSGGRYANASFWLDDYNGKWATSTYYQDIPWHVDRFNSREAIGNLQENNWFQAHSHYVGFPYSGSRTQFAYKFTKDDSQRFIKIKQTPLINSQVTNFAVHFIDQAGLGNDSFPDLLSLTYYAGNYKYGNAVDEYNFEIQDIYYQLDRELAKLFDAIEKKIGLEKVLIVVSSTGYFDAGSKTDSEIKPFGEFYPSRCTALLNMYLSATYGQGNWLEYYYDNQLYFNKKLVEEKGLNWNEFIAFAGEFIAQFSGVQDVTTFSQWLVDDTGRSVAFRRGMNKKTSGDIFIELQPGWVIADENNTDTYRFQRNTGILNPIFFLGNHIQHKHVYRTIKVTEIAPTISYILRIRPPNGTKDKPLEEFFY